MPCANRKQWEDGSWQNGTVSLANLFASLLRCGFFSDWLPDAFSYRGICERSRIVWITDVTCVSHLLVSLHMAYECDLSIFWSEADSCLLSLPSPKWFRGVSRRERGPMWFCNVFLCWIDWETCSAAWMMNDTTEAFDSKLNCWTVRHFTYKFWCAVGLPLWNTTLQRNNICYLQTFPSCLDIVKFLQPTFLLSCSR